MRSVAISAFRGMKVHKLLLTFLNKMIKYTHNHNTFYNIILIRLSIVLKFVYKNSVL